MLAGVVSLLLAQLRNFFVFFLTQIVSYLKVGEDHESTKESSEYLESLTQQAVVLQKAINRIYSDTSSVFTPPPKVCTVF